MSIIQDIFDAVITGKAKIIGEMVQTAIDEDITAQVILNDGMLAAMDLVGERFKNGDVFIPEMLIAARAMNAGMDVLKPHLTEAGVTSIGKAVLGTVKGDQHDIGKNLVRIMFEGKGIEVIDLGTDVSPERFVDTAVEQGATIIACSALLTTTMNEMKNVVNLLDARGLRDKITVMVGGAPITQAFCDLIGADYYSKDAATAADIAKSVLVG